MRVLDILLTLKDIEKLIYREIIIEDLPPDGEVSGARCVDGKFYIRIKSDSYDDVGESEDVPVKHLILGRSSEIRYLYDRNYRYMS